MDKHTADQQLVVSGKEADMIRELMGLDDEDIELVVGLIKNLKRTKKK